MDEKTEAQGTQWLRSIRLLSAPRATGVSHMPRHLEGLIAGPGEGRPSSVSSAFVSRGRGMAQDFLGHPKPP